MTTDTPMTGRPMDADPGCTEVRQLLSAYHDDELPPGQSASVARHLAACGACARENEQLRQTSVTMREMLRPVAAPDLLRARVRSALRGQAGSATMAEREPVVRRVRWMPQIAAGLIIAAASSGATTIFMMHRLAPRESPGRDVLASHTRSLMTNHVTDIVSTDQHNVKPWFNGKVDFSPDVYRLDDAGFPLVGGRVDYVGDRPAAVLVYGRRKHLIDVFTWPESSDHASPPAGVAVERDRGYNLLQWTGDGMHFWAVSDLNVEELREFVNAFRQRQEAPAATAPNTPAPPITARPDT